MNNIEFIEKDHKYIVTEGGIEYAPPSVTTYISEIDPEYENIPQETLEKAALRGSTVHSHIERFFKEGITPEEKTPEAVIARCGINLLMAHGTYGIFSEQPVVYEFNDMPLFAGTADCVAILDGRITLIDFKTTAQLHDYSLRLQLSAYKMAIEQMFPAMKIECCKCLWLPFAEAKDTFPQYVQIEPLKEEEIISLFTRSALGQNTIKKNSEVAHYERLEEVPF